MTQYGEDALILNYFAGRTGRFLDVGAGDGVTFSNTEPLLQLGWSGVMIEPSPTQLRWLYTNHGENKRVEICPFALGELSGTSLLWDGGRCHSMFSTTSKVHRDLILTHSEGAVPYRELHTVVLSWQDLLALYPPGPYEFVNIDVEGNNLELLASLPFEAVKPSMVCVEIDPAWLLEAMKYQLSAAGLTESQVVGGNLLAWRK